MKPSLMILAAGMGSRYGGLKQLDSVGPSDETIMDYSIYDAIRAGFEKVVFIIRKDIEEAFNEKIISKYKDKIETACGFQEIDSLPEGFSIPEGREKPWGTSHAILAAKGLVNEPFAMINSDDYYGKDSYKTIYDYLSTAEDKEKADYSMVGFQLDKTLSDFGAVTRGICNADENGNLDKITEAFEIKRENGDIKSSIGVLNGKEVASMNMFGFTPSLFTHLETQFLEFLKESGQELKSEFLIPTSVAELIAKEQADMKVLTSDATWLGITYQDDKPYVTQCIRELVEKGEYPNNLWS